MRNKKPYSTGFLFTVHHALDAACCTGKSFAVFDFRFYQVGTDVFSILLGQVLFALQI